MHRSAVDRQIDAFPTHRVETECTVPRDTKRTMQTTFAPKRIARTILDTKRIVQTVFDAKRIAQIAPPLEATGSVDLSIAR